MAVRMLTGKAISPAMTVTHSVPMMKGKNPNSSREGRHAEEKRRSPNVLVWSRGQDFSIRPAPISRTIATIAAAVRYMSSVAVVSIALLSDIFIPLPAGGAAARVDAPLSSLLD
jgi:hypothetical protein